MDSKKIDWLNHAIAFAASVIGIFIAFQLDDWQEQRSRRAQLETTLKGIKAEIEGNLAIYHENDSLLQQFVSYADFYDRHFDNGALLCTDRALQDARRINPERFGDLKYVGKVNDTTKRYEMTFTFDFLPTSGISTANWDNARSSGILVHVDHDRVVLLTRVYEWTSKKLGISDEELENNLFAFHNVEQLRHDYRLISRSYGVKYRHVKQYYEQIKW
jgi:hypothetical protein